jgi:CheY-like chemotaxis protein
VSTGAAAIARAGETVYDAITLDLLLPDLGGQDVLRAIRSQGLNQRTPVIVATVVPHKGLSSGFHVVDVLLKPVQAEDLLDALARAGVTLGGGVRVVVVDDDPLALKLAERGLREAGFDPVCCNDGEVALQAVEREPPAAIVLDLVMPSMNGFDFLDRLRRSPRGRRIAVIVWTQKDLSAVERERLAAAAEAVVSKAEGPGSLIEELRGYALPAGRLVLGGGRHGG